MESLRIEFGENVIVFGDRVCHAADAEVRVGDAEPGPGFGLVERRQLDRCSVNEVRLLAGGGSASVDDRRLFVLGRMSRSHVVAGAIENVGKAESRGAVRAVPRLARARQTTAWPRKLRKRVARSGLSSTWPSANG